MTYISKCYWSPSSCSSVFVSIIFLLLSIFRRSSQWASFYIQKNAKNNYTIFWHGKSENVNTFCFRILINFVILNAWNLPIYVCNFLIQKWPIVKKWGGPCLFMGKGSSSSISFVLTVQHQSWKSRGINWVWFMEVV